MNSLTWLTAAALVASACGGGDGGGGGGAADAGSDGPIGDAAPTPADAHIPVDVVFRTYVDGIQSPLEWVAIQIDDGVWEVVSSQTGEYQFSPTTGRYAIASMCSSSDDVDLMFLHATADELPDPYRRCGSRAPSGTLGTIQVSIPTLGDGILARVDLGSSQSEALITTEYKTRTYSGYSTQLNDVILQLDSNESSDSKLDRIRIERDVRVTAGETTAITVGTAADDWIAKMPVTITPQGSLLPLEEARTSLSLWTTKGTLGGLYINEANGYGGVPNSALAGSDIHVTQVAGFDATEGERSYRYTRTFHRQAANVMLEYPPTFALTSAGAAATTPHVRLKFEFPDYPNADVYVFEARTPDREVSAFVTSGYQGAGDTHIWEQPDLTGLDGWDNLWSVANSEIEMFSRALTSTDGEAYRNWVEYNLVTNGPPPDLEGVTFTECWKESSFTP